MIYVMGDIHGNMRRFNSVMEQIQLKADDTLYVLGDVIDRYPDGLVILRKLMAMPNVKMILGNHEYMMLRAIGDPAQPRYMPTRDIRIWYNNGGDVTHRALKHLRIVTRQEIFAYLEALPLNIDISLNGKQYKLVHGGPLEEYPRFIHEFEDERYYAVWKRWARYDWEPEDYTMIFGHTPTDNYQEGKKLQIWFGHNRIGMDCGSGYPMQIYPNFGHQGRLACLRLDDMQEFYSEEDSLLKSQPGERRDG